MPQTSNRHTYLKTHQISGQMLRFRLPAEADALREQAMMSKVGRAGKTLVKDGPLRITQVALRRGTPLQSHHVEGAVSVHILRGRLRLTTAGGDVDLAPGELAALDAGVVHAASALSDCIILITTAMR
jgi:quercetin dioxygenase-like cupin family protein